MISHAYSFDIILKFVSRKFIKHIPFAVRLQANECHKIFIFNIWLFKIGHDYYLLYFGKKWKCSFAFSNQGIHSVANWACFAGIAFSFLCFNLISLVFFSFVYFPTSTAPFQSVLQSTARKVFFQKLKTFPLLLCAKFISKSCVQKQIYHEAKELKPQGPSHAQICPKASYLYLCL